MGYKIEQVNNTDLDKIVVPEPIVVEVVSVDFEFTEEEFKKLPMLIK